MSFAPDPPKTPNPYVVASAQTAANISTAIANTYLGNANVVSPQGTMTFEQTGTYELADPQYNSNGVLASTTTREIPIFTQTIELSTKGQAIYDANQDMQLNLNTLGKNQLESLQSTLGVPFTLTGLPAKAEAPAAPTLNETISQPHTIATTVGAADTSEDRDAVTQAVLSRLQYQIGLDRAQRDAELQNMGVFPGSEAYDNEMRVIDFRSNDAGVQAILAGGQEQTRQFAIQHQQAKYALEASEVDFRQKMLVVDFSNRTVLQRFQVLMQIADFINTYRERAMQETLAARNQPMNELTAMLHGGQISVPSFTGFKGGTISDTPLGQYVYQSAALDQQNYQMKVQQQNAMISGIAQIGGAALAAPMSGGGSVGGNLLGKFLS